MSFITAIGTANPEHRFSQMQIADFMLSTMHLENGDSRKLKSIFKLSGIEYRYSVLGDYGKTHGFDFYPADKASTLPSTQRRISLYQQHALTLSMKAVDRLIAKYDHFDAGKVTHLITVSCTGMYAPGLDIDLVRALNLSRSVHRTAVNFMGCYAAFSALKVAEAFCTADKDAKVLIVCTELCSIHFQAAGSEDNILANALFGDGAAAVLMEGQSVGSLQIEVMRFYNDLYFEGDQSMAWRVGDLGFEMKLSSYVPDMIRNGIATLTNTLLKQAELSRKDIDFFAIHPGGKKILEAIESELQLSSGANQEAYEVLKNFGNMSSATVLFVLERVIEKLTVADRDKNILSFAFGPGLTLESMLLKIKNV